MLTVLKNFRIVDSSMDTYGSLILEDGIIREVLPAAHPSSARIIDGALLGTAEEAVLMPAFTDLHAHFRDPFLPETPPEAGSPAMPENLESASLAAAAGGYGTVVCMANTRPPLDRLGMILSLKKRADALGLIDLYPAMALTRGMEGKELSEIAGLPAPDGENSPSSCIRLLSEDGRDVADDALFLAAMEEARRLGLPVSCHCDAGGAEAEAAKKAGEGRDVWSRIEENNAVRRAIALGRRAGCRIHIAHVSTAEAAALIRRAKAELPQGALSAEATPHHITLTEADARRLGAESFGRVNPSLRGEEDRRAIMAALLDGTIDAVATDHAPHGEADKAAGSPGFSGLETAFAVCYGELAGKGLLSLSLLSRLMSAAPAAILGLGDRGSIAPGRRADLVIVDTGAVLTVDPAFFKTRGKNSPFAGRELRGRILMTINRGRVVFEA
jgi:dihydroorotase